MNANRALGHLLRQAIRHALGLDHNRDSWGVFHCSNAKGCCPVCCGTCSTLMWYRDEASVAADDALLETVDGTFREDWQTPSGRIDWYYLTNAWNRYDCPDADDHEEIGGSR